MINDWITTVEAIELSGYHADYLRELLREGKVNGQKWGREWQVSRASLLAYLDKATMLGEKRGPKSAHVEDDKTDTSSA